MGTSRKYIAATVAALCVVILAGAAVALYHRKSVEQAGAPRASAPPIHPPLKPGVEFAAYPEDFPADLAFIPALFDQAGHVSLPDGNRIVQLSLTFNVSPAAAVSRFRDELEPKGWTIFEQKAGKGTLLKAVSGQSRADIAIESSGKAAAKVTISSYAY